MKRILLILATICLATNCLATRATAESTDSATRATDRLLTDATDQVLDKFEFLDACLVSGGTDDPQRIVHWRSVYLQHQLRLQKLIAQHGVKKSALPRYIFEYLQSEVLVGPYETLCTDVRRTLNDGTYNCVTGSVLYTCLCRNHGVPVEIHAVTGHVFCRLKSTQAVIETTCDNWFQLTSKQRNLEIYHRSRVLSEIQLLGKVFYNRGIQAAEKEQFSSAVKMFRFGVQLDRDDMAAKENLLATLNNWALHECQLDRFQRAVKLLEIGWSLDQHYEPLLKNDFHIHQRWVTKLCRDGQWGQALDILEQCCQRRKDALLFHQMKHAVERNRAYAELKNGS